MKRKILSILLALVLIVGLLPLSALAGEELRSVYITITAPIEGQSPDYNPVARMDNSFIGNAVGYSITDVRWVETFKDNSPDKTLTENSIFEAGHSYTVWLTLEAESGYELYSNLYPWFNEVSANSKGSLMPGGNVITREIYKSFTVEEAEIIPSVSLTVTEPAAGKTPSFTAGTGSLYSVNTSYKSDAFVNGVAWYKMKGPDVINEREKALKETDSFEASARYAVAVVLKADAGYRFSGAALTDYSLSKVNGKDASFVTNQGAGNTLVVYYVFDTLPAAKMLTSVSLTVTPPVLGENPDYTVKVNTEGVHIDTAYQENGFVNGVFWGWTLTKDYNQQATAITASDKFEKGKYYGVGVRLLPDDGYHFFPDAVYGPNKISVKINGQDAAIAVYDGTALSAVYLFDPVGETLSENPFTDIQESAYYYYAVLWAVSHEPQITAGTSATTFSPNNPCTRAQAVTFLWRAAGQPEPKTSSNPFTDVKSSAYYYKAVLWAAETGVTAGTSDTTFSPDQPCTRGQIVTFLWRYMNKPNPLASGNPFTDIKGGEYYYTPVIWAVGAKVTAGTTATTFSPGATCTRGQIVTFLHRAVG